MREIENGGRVRIKTINPESLAAVHEFLRFQIADRQTGSGRAGKCRDLK